MIPRRTLAGTPPSAEALASGPPDEDRLALRFAELHKDKLRYCHDTGAWFEWDGAIWRQQRTPKAFHWARLVCRSAKNSRFSRAAVAAAVERYARADPVFAVTADVWNNDPWLLGTPAGTVDLRTGRLREATQSDYISKSTDVPPAPTADCPQWQRFLAEVTQGDAGLARFLQQFFGYCLTGSTQEHALIFVYGVGGNGKTVLVETVQHAVMGDYACPAAMDTFVASVYGRHPTELARLHGIRMVTASETEQGHNWNETKIKELTGGGTITARFMRQDFFNYVPAFKAVFVGNFQPHLRDVGEATRRRFAIVPFMFQPQRIDRHLADKLQDEAPGILRWQIDGCLDWQRRGLVRPDVVLKATADYFAEQDRVARWREERCDITNRAAEGVAATLYADFCFYMETAHEPGLTSQEFAEQMRRLGHDKHKAKQRGGELRDRHVYQGIALRAHQRDQRAF